MTNNNPSGTGPKRRKRRREPPALRFARRIQASPDSCWLWLGAKNETGYGVMGRGGRGEGAIKAHRLSYQIFHGVTLDRHQHVLHQCDNPACVNPNHLVVGTHRENMEDMRRKQRNSKPPRWIGTANRQAKLDSDKVKQIFAMRQMGATHAEIAKQMGTSRVAISAVLQRKTWRHVDVTNYLR